MTIVRLILICLFSLSIAAAYAKEKENIQFSKIDFTDIEVANKVLISLHHAILEINHQEKYLIADITEDEKALLVKHGLIVSPANDWTEKFNRFNDNNKQRVSSAKINKSIPGFPCYPTVEETFQQANALAEQFPLLSSWNDIGDSWLKTNNLAGYDLMVLKITNSEIDTDKPKLFIHSSMHAREYTPAALNLDFAKWLLNEYDSNAEARWLVDYREIHLLFHMNPDGRKIAETQVLQRKNTNQNHCPTSDVGVDLNRNFAQKWNTTEFGSSGNECSTVYRGIAPESEPETQAVSSYIRSLFPDERGEGDDDAAPVDKPGLHLDLHSYGQLILWPYGHKQDSAPNNRGFVNLGNKLAWFNNYSPQQSIGLYATDGTSDNVSYGELGVAAIAFELGTSFFQSCASYTSEIKPDNLAALIYAAKVAKMPYLLPLGPDISTIAVNGSLQQATVPKGTTVDLAIAASIYQTKLATNPNDIVAIEYSLDVPFGQQGAQVHALVETFARDDSGSASATAQIDTSALIEGSHIIYVRAKNSQDQYGVANAVFIHIDENNSPRASFNVSCQELSCRFDASTSSDVDGSITSYQWQFAQESTELGVVTNHTFNSQGEKLVTLTVEDDLGAKAITERSVSVTSAEVITVTSQKSNSNSGGSVSWLFLMLLLFRVIKVKQAV